MFNTINLYIAKKFVKILLYFSLALMFIIFISNFLTNIKLSPSNETFTLDILVKSLCDIPQFFQIALPYVVLVTTLFFIRNMNNSNELDIIMSCGISVTHIIKIILPITIFTGLLVIFIISPLNIFLKNKFLNSMSNSVSTTGDSFWLLDKQNNNTLLIIKTQKAYIKNKVIYLNKIIVFKIVDNKFSLRIDGQSGEIYNGKLIMHNASVKDINSMFPHQYKTYTIDSNLKAKSIQNAAIEPDMINFWQLLRFTKNLEMIGLCTNEYKVYFYNLMFYPINLFTMFILGIGLSLSKEKRIGNTKIIIIGVIVGFILKFFTDLVNAFGTAGLISPFFTVLCAQILIFSIGLYLIINKEGL